MELTGALSEPLLALGDQERSGLGDSVLQPVLAVLALERGEDDLAGVVLGQVLVGIREVVADGFEDCPGG
ncbi:hypothetical protein [Nocardiopsis sp. NPDC057823]|uniref:hypothetical protein n=1 Tax=Nocardiopsis sp. NPDC057823 TaxID=3346256 RepID=UPI003672CEAD